MSNTPGISPITTDIEDVRHSDEDGFFRDEGENIVEEEDTEEPHAGDRDDRPSRER